MSNIIPKKIGLYAKFLSPKDSKNQIFIILDIVPVNVWRVDAAHRRNLRQCIHCKVALVASQWQLVFIIPTRGLNPVSRDIGAGTSTTRHWARTSTTRPSGRSPESLNIQYFVLADPKNTVYR